MSDVEKAAADAAVRTAGAAAEVAVAAVVQTSNDFIAGNRVDATACLMQPAVRRGW